MIPIYIYIFFLTCEPLHKYFLNVFCFMGEDKLCCHSASLHSGHLFVLPLSQGHMHGKRMREANHRAAVQIFERVNSSLLPQNILDLHGLHVDEALRHLAQVLHDKTTGNDDILSVHTVRLHKEHRREHSGII